MNDDIQIYISYSTATEMRTTNVIALNKLYSHFFIKKKEPSPLKETAL